MLGSFLQLPGNKMSAVLGRGVAQTAPCKWCSWKGGPSVGNSLPFGLKLYQDADVGGLSLGHVYGDSTWVQGALYGLLDVLVPCGKYLPLECC